MKNISEALVDPSILIPKTQLYPKFWDPKVRKLNSQYLQRLKEIAKAFVSTFDFQIKIKDIIFTGSLANYNWNQYSDVDLHIVVDFADIPDEYLEAFKDYFDAKKENWNNKHNIMIGGHEVELYIQDVEEPHHSSGVYSIMNDRWLTEPRHFDQDLDYEKIVDRTEQYADEIARAQEFYAAGDLNRALNYIDRLRAKLKKYRQAGLKSEGEYSTENLVFKSLRNGGYLEQLAVLKRQISDKKLSLDENLISEKLDRCARIAKRRYKVWPCVPENNSAALTRYGWKCVNDLKIGEDIMTYNIELDILEFKPIINLHRFKNVPTRVIRSGNTGFIFECTNNHKWAVKLPATKKSARKKHKTINDVCLMDAETLLESKSNKQLIVSALFDEKNKGIKKEKIYKYGDNWIKYILDCSAEQRQAWLFSALIYDGNQVKIERLIDNKNENETLEYLYDNKLGYQSFGFKQKDLIHRDAFLLAAFLNAGSVTWKKAKNKNIYNCFYIANKRYKNTSNFKVINHNITDVWCPETENNTWVMKQEVGDNGIISITGNSAYASGAAVKCRQGKIWKGVKEVTDIEEELNEIELDENDLEEILDEKADFSKEKDQGLHGWFARQGGEGKSKGWVDCNTCRKDAETGKKTCKSCGRGEGEKRTKYPACRPTPSQCTRSGMKRKKSSKQVSWKSKED